MVVAEEVVTTAANLVIWAETALIAEVEAVEVVLAVIRAVNQDTCLASARRRDPEEAIVVATIVANLDISGFFAFLLLF